MEDLQNQMKLALRRFAKSVNVISAEHDGQRYAVAATAVSEVSLAPPTMLVCINASASIFGPLNGGTSFTINMLSDEQDDIAKACGGEMPAQDRFKIDGWAQDEKGYWYLAHAQASFMCSLREKVDVGTHTIFIGDVRQVRIFGDVAPLIYSDKSYSRVAPVKSD